MAGFLCVLCGLLCDLRGQAVDLEVKVLTAKDAKGTRKGRKESLVKNREQAWASGFRLYQSCWRL
jgi:hypothetical protein